MSQFFEIISKWDPLSQLFFFLVVLAGIGSLLRYVVYHISVICRGWPRHVTVTEEKEDGEGEQRSEKRQEEKEAQKRAGDG